MAMGDVEGNDQMELKMGGELEVGLNGWERLNFF